ncbi:hypothetical protein N0V93_004318 [Gnomoniopsis smithogilvyi]|uniref:Uncharacterized protein n=1 Tax=Gnomoniopsis smithogilvyi TaxID=1191159 RepID=A0A9W8YSE6_9PEZI|nr:hypothetical protein N0V93_004318 [Gnomoniopsis smithogilvyi]
MPSSNVNNNNNNDFFSQVSTQGLPEKDQKTQPWKDFHEPNGDLVAPGSLVVDIPKTEETGGYLGRSTQTGSLGGH